MASPLGANRKQTPLMTVTTSQGRKGGRIDIWLGKEKTPKPEKAAEGTEEWAKVTISDPPLSPSLCLSFRLRPAASFKRRARALNLCQGGKRKGGE